MLAAFDRGGDTDQLAEAVRVARLATDAAPAGPRRAASLANLSNHLAMVFEHSGDVDALAEGVRAAREAVAQTDDDHPAKAACLTNLSGILQRWWGRTGDPQAVTEAVEAGRRAVELTPGDHPDLAGRLSNLGVALQRRFERDGDLGSVAEAVEVGRRAADAVAADDPDRGVVLSSLGLALRALADRTGEQAAAAQAVAVTRRAVAAVPSGHVNRAGYLSNLGLALQRLGRLGDAGLAEAVQVAREAVAAVPDGHPDRAKYLSNLGVALRRRSAQTGDPGVLAEAIAVGRQAVAMSREDHPERAGYQANLGHALEAMAVLSSDRTTAREAHETFASAAASPAAAPTTRIVAAWGWGRAAMLAADPHGALAGFEAAVALLPQVTPRRLARADREFGLGELSGFAGHAAAAALAAGKPGRAVELLEQARGVLLAEQLDGRSDFTVLRERHGDLAVRLAELRDKLEAVQDSTTAGWESEYRRQLQAEWDHLIDQIRSRPGFGDFLQAPSIRRLSRQASAGPIVLICASPWRSDAVILTASRDWAVRVVPLPGVTEDAVATRSPGCSPPALQPRAASPTGPCPARLRPG